ncbi:MAG: hypothetical protein AAF431_04195 [Pseudomonadota bacterium]
MGNAHVKVFNKEIATIAEKGQFRPVVLVARKPDRLACAYEFAKQNIEVHFSSDFEMFDLRYVLADSDLAVLGEKQTSGSNENYTVTTNWREVRSAAIVRLLRDRFEESINDPKTISFDEYAQYCAFMYRKDRAALKMPTEFWSNYLSPRFVEDGHVPLVLIVGRPGSGKSTFSRRVITKLPKTTPLRSGTHIPDYDYFKAQFEHVDTVDGIARRVDGGYLLNDPDNMFKQATQDVIRRIKKNRDSATAPDIIIAEIARSTYINDIEEFKHAGLEPDGIVYVDAPFDICSSRNRDRPNSIAGDTHMVSKEEMERSYAKDDLEALNLHYSDRLLIINNSIDGDAHVDAAVKSFIELALPKIIRA